MSPLTPNFEPFRARIVEPIPRSTLEQRRRWLREADYSLFRLPAQQVMIDLLTDSGTGAMSSRQWAAMMQSDESYAGSASYERLTETCRELLGISHVVPAPQGRAAERLLVETVIGKPAAGTGMVVPNNAHFDTTRSMIEASGAATVNLLADAGEDPTSDAPFKGDMDTEKLQRLLKERADTVPFVMLTLTCNSNGGQPVSLDNLRTVRDVCDQYGKLLFLDACRVMENAWLIKQREPGQSDRSIASIVRTIFDHCDGAAMSARKDGLCNCGGLLLLRSSELFAKACSLCVLTQGFQMSTNGVAGRDLEAMAVGLRDAMDESYLQQRAAMIASLTQRAASAGLPVVQPTGGHGLWIDSRTFCSHLSSSAALDVSHAMACALYERSGIRASCVGSVLRDQRGKPMELLRLAIPRRTYGPSHLEYVGDALIDLYAHAREIEQVKSHASAPLKYVEPAYEVA